MGVAAEREYKRGASSSLRIMPRRIACTRRTSRLWAGLQEAIGDTRLAQELDPLSLCDQHLEISWNSYMAPGV